ncbi:MAG: NAD(P)-dependent alcohol dehydrogenase [bacterium]|nr:NAD(P)-dependent alcohol dehydrogenase [bacterium]
MKAITFDKYGVAGDVLHLEDIDRPTLDGDEVLIRVAAASVNPYDWHFMTGRPLIMRTQMGLRMKEASGLGGDLAGRVEAVGDAVTRFKEGDEVFGEVNGATADNPELELGTVAEYVAVSEDWLMPRPANFTPEEAAAVPLAAITALQGLRDYGKVQKDDRVLINGASGGVGTYAVQLAKFYGAEVTGVCSTRNIEMVRSLGADHIIDYTADDFTLGRPRFDLILDNVGNRSLRECRRVLTRGGMYLASFGQKHHKVMGPMATLLWMKIFNRFVPQDMVSLDQERKIEDLPFLTELMADGKLKSIVDRTFPLDQAVAAMDYLGEGHARGKVVITV